MIGVTRPLRGARLRGRFVAWSLVVGLLALITVLFTQRALHDSQSPLSTPASGSGPPDIESELQRAAELQRGAERQSDAQRRQDLESPQATDSTWVLWRRLQNASHREKWGDWTRSGSAFSTFSKCWAKIHRDTGVAEVGSLADWYQWARGLGRYSKRHDIVATESGIWVMTAPISSEWRCLPDTVDPQGPKGK